MQRQKYILKNSSNSSKSRNGMAMIMAIIVLVIIATIMALSLALTTQTSKKTTDIYLHEQAVLLSHSSAKYAMLKISQAPPCSLANIAPFSYNEMFDINITMKYISLSSSSCDGNAGTNKYATVTYVDPDGEFTTDGTVILDITVSTKADVVTEPIRYFRRSFQKM